MLNDYRVRIRHAKAAHMFAVRVNLSRCGAADRDKYKDRPAIEPIAPSGQAQGMRREPAVRVIELR
jgi:hypothetical protein